VNKINIINNINIYPNPTSEIIHIPDVSPQSYYVIYDVSGKEICTGKLNNNNDVNVSDLHSGLYYIRITLSQETYSGKFIVK
ncbi:MAG: T9SS type A sorting domain-containing protein, partial [Bacteroidales bacterium]|nr:T9SS type A sorting domain-containing protein [Bacteroidales bacterium]